MTVKFQPKLTVPTSLPTSRPTQATPTRVGPNAQRQNERSTFEPPAIRYTGRPVLNPPRLPGSNDTHRPESYTGRPHGSPYIPGAPGIERHIDINPNSIPGAPGIERPIHTGPDVNRPPLLGGPIITGPDGHCPHTSGGPVINDPPVGIVPDGVDPLALARRLAPFRG